MAHFNATDAAAIAATITTEGGSVEIHMDVESTSLNGTGFAFGAIVRQGEAELGEVAGIAREGVALIEAGGDRTAFVREQILPHLGDLPEVATLAELGELWLSLYDAVKNRVMEVHGIQPWETGKLRRRMAVVIDNGIPVEALFNSAAIENRVVAAEGSFKEGDDYFMSVTTKELGGMYMPRDISTALEVLGYDPDLPRSDVAEALGVTGPKHHPVVDARQSMVVYDAAKRGDAVLDAHKL